MQQAKQQDAYISSASKGWRRNHEHSTSTPNPHQYRLLPFKKGGDVSAEDIAQIIDEDEFDIEEVLENWLEFLQVEPIEGKTRYSLYHSSFCNWLSQQLNAA